MHLFTKIHVALKQGIHHLHQFLYRAMIMTQAVFLTALGQHICMGFVVGQHVAAAKAVNGLLWVTNHDHTTLLITLGIPPNTRQHIVLILIGVLKLIDQN